MTTPNAEAGAAGTPPADPTAPPAAAPKAPEAPPAAKASEKVETKPDAKAEAKEKEDLRELSGDGDDVPEDGKLFKLSAAALTKRLARHSKKELREHFGTDDPEEIKAKLAKFGEYEKKAEEERRQALSDKEKSDEDLRKEKERADKAEAAYQRAIDAQTFSEYNATATKVFDKYFEADEDTREFVTSRLHKHLLSLDDKEAPADAKKAEKYFDKWAKDYAEKHPRYAIKVEEEKKDEKQKISLSTGANPNRPEKGDPNLVTKTAKPGQANSMTKTEYAAFKRSQGLSS